MAYRQTPSNMWWCELAHIAIDHSPPFTEEVETYLPDWKRRRDLPSIKPPLPPGQFLVISDKPPHFYLRFGKNTAKQLTVRQTLIG